MKKLLAPTVGLLLLGLAGCGAADEVPVPEPPQTAPEQAESGAAPIEAGGKDVAFGETAGISNGEGGKYAITASALQDVAEFSVPPVDGKYVSTDVEASLISGTGGAVASVGFMLVDAAGNEYVSAAPNGENMDGVLFATLLTQGDSGSGKVFFDVPADATGLKLVFQPLTATEPLGSWS